MPDVCRGCAQAAVRPMFDLGALPLAGGFLRGREEIAGEQRYLLLVSICDACALVQIVDPVDPEILFSEFETLSSGPSAEQQGSDDATVPEAAFEASEADEAVGTATEQPDDAGSGEQDNAPDNAQHTEHDDDATTVRYLDSSRSA